MIRLAKYTLTVVLFIMTESIGFAQATIDSLMAEELASAGKHSEAAEMYHSLYKKHGDVLFIDLYCNNLYYANEIKKLHKTIQKLQKSNDTIALALIAQRFNDVQLQSKLQQQTAIKPIGTLPDMEFPNKTKIYNLSQDSIRAFTLFFNSEYAHASEVFWLLYRKTHAKEYFSFYLNCLVNERDIEKVKKNIRSEMKRTGDFSMMRRYRDFFGFETKYQDMNENTDSITAFKYYADKRFNDATENFRHLYKTTGDTLYLKYYLSCLKQTGNYGQARTVLQKELENNQYNFIVNNAIADKTVTIYDNDMQALKSQNVQNDLLFYNQKNDVVIKYIQDINLIKETLTETVVNPFIKKVVTHETAIYDFYDSESIIRLYADTVITFEENETEQPPFVINKTLDVDSAIYASNVMLDNSVTQFCNAVENVFFVEKWVFNSNNFEFNKHVIAIGPVLNDSVNNRFKNNYVKNAPFISFFDNTRVDSKNVGENTDEQVITDVSYKFDLHNEYFSDLFAFNSYSKTMERIQQWHKNRNDWCKNLDANHWVSQIIDAVNTGRVPAYDFVTGEQLDVVETAKRCGKQVDSLWVHDEATGDMFLKEFEKAIDPGEFNSIIFIEDWYYNNKLFYLKKKVKYIALVRYINVYANDKIIDRVENIVFKVTVL